MDARPRRSGTPCSAAIIDLDFFKRISGRYGRPVGDEVLRSFAVSVAADIRASTKLGRYGARNST
ncbi:diguanylate cyclase [Bradyrhizobium diazoefficiens]|uniref:diguanylate cyclase n=1 Tax=Bradyrhizobium diazoefficiens TaxID=1355477 RepID=UPI0019099EEC|nr:diguanylate cyclase [Bradyrhizobium diazoefficiens]